jgi:hypothetical protein
MSMAKIEREVDYSREEKSCPGITSCTTLFEWKVTHRPARKHRVYVRARIVLLTAAVTSMRDGR